MLTVLGLLTMVSGNPIEPNTCSNPSFMVERSVNAQTEMADLTLRGNITTQQRGYSYQFERNGTDTATLTLSQHSGNKSGRGLPALQHIAIHETFSVPQSMTTLTIHFIAYGKTSTFTCDVTQP